MQVPDKRKSSYDARIEALERGSVDDYEQIATMAQADEMRRLQGGLPGLETNEYDDGNLISTVG
jgi:hypothetical protein